MKLIWLPSWYPNKLSPYDGDFIQRHAQAVSQEADVQVLYVVKDIAGRITQTVHREEQTSGRLKETIIYYYVPPRLGLISAAWSFIKRKMIYRRFIKQYIVQNGKPDLLHVHIAMNAGQEVLYVKRKYGIPYVLTEHWTGYLAEADDRLEQHSIFYRYWLKKIIRRASKITTVSHVLGKAMQQYFPGMEYIVVPNVVNTAIFYPGPPKHKARLKLVHISNLRPQKHPKLLLEALAMLRGRGVDFTMDIFGEKDEEVITLSGFFGLQQHVFFKGEVPQPMLADALREADALVFYSAYETFGCVIIEANACGLPVIVSDIPVFHETVEEGINGIFAKPASAAELCSALLKFTEARQQFQPSQIAAGTEKYNYQQVARQFMNIYHQL